VYKIIGLVYAGTSDFSFAYASPIHAIEDELNVEAWDGKLYLPTSAYGAKFDGVCYGKERTLKKFQTHVPDYIYGNCEECANPIQPSWADENGVDEITSILRVPILGQTTIEKVVYLWFDRGDPQSRTPLEDCDSGEYRITNIRLTVACFNGEFSGQSNKHGQECVDEKWISVRSDGIRTFYCDSMTDDNQSTYKAIGGGFTNSADYLALGNMYADSARKLHIRITVPEGAESTVAVFPQLVVQYNVTNESSSSYSVSSTSSSLSSSESKSESSSLSSSESKSSSSESKSDSSTSSESSLSSSSESSLSSSSSSSADSKSSSSVSESSTSSSSESSYEFFEELYYPAASNDDGFATETETIFNNTSNYCIVGFTNYIGFIRFPNVQIPHSAEIIHCGLRVRGYPYTANNVDDVNLKLHFNLETSASAPTAASDLTGASLTTGTEWHEVKAFDRFFPGGTHYNSPDLRRDLQEVIDLATWGSGNDLLLQIRSDGSGTYASRRFAAIEYLSGIWKAELYVEWFIPPSVSSSLSSSESKSSSSSESSSSSSLSSSSLSSSSESSSSSSLSSSSESSLSSLSSSSSSSESSSSSSSESSSESKSDSSSSSSSSDSSSESKSDSSSSSSSSSSESSSSQSSSSSSESKSSSSSQSSSSSSESKSSSSSPSSSSESSSESKSESSSSSSHSSYTGQYEKLENWDITDPENDFTVETLKIAAVDSDRAAAHWASEDYGADYFGDFTINFECATTDWPQGALVMGLIAVTNTPGTYEDMVDADDGLQAFLYSNGSTGYMYAKNGNDSSSGGTVSRPLPLKYGQIKRRGSDFTATLYNDSDRTENHVTRTVTCTTALCRYLVILQNYDDLSGGDRSWYVQNVEIIDTDYSSSSSSESQSSSSSSSESIP
jgi:hypothetical protein